MPCNWLGSNGVLNVIRSACTRGSDSSKKRGQAKEFRSGAILGTV